MSEIETVTSQQVVTPLDSGERLGWLRAGIAALEARLEAHDGAAKPEEQAMLVTLLMSLEDALRKLEADADATLEAGGPRLDAGVVELKTHLTDVGGRVRTRVLYSGARSRPSSALLRIAPWVASAPARGQRLTLASRALTGIGLLVSLFLLFEFVFSGLFHDRAQRDLLVGFKQQISTTSLDAPSAAAPEGSPVGLLHINRLGLDEVIVEGTSPDDLKKGPGHLRAAPMPGEFGNAVIAGRRTTYGSPFRHLDLLRIGDPIRVTTGQGVFLYRVSSVQHVSAGTAAPLTAKLDNRLTLVTSDPAYAPSRRLVVVATLAPLAAASDSKGTPLDVAGRPPVAATISELGLTGDPTGLILVLIFGQLLIAAIWITNRAWRRWPHSLTLLFAVPTILALTVLVFWNLDRLLPGTL